MSKAYYVHYKNKYPHAQVNISESSLTVTQLGEELIRMQKDANGSLKCVSKEFGCKFEHDLSPIAKECRHRKLNADGSIGMDDKFEERKAACDADMDAYYHNIDGILKAKSVKESEDYKAAKK